MPQRAKLAACIAITVWATAFVIIQADEPYFSPAALAFARDIIAAIALFMVCLVHKEKLPTKAAWPGICVAGIIWFGIYMFCVNWAEKHVDASITSVLVKIGPIFIAIFSAIWLKERLSKSMILGIILSFIGVILIGIAPGISKGASIVGIVICLLAAAMHAVSVVIQKYTLSYCSALQFNVWSMLVASLILLPFSATLMKEMHQAPPHALWSLLYIGIVPTAIGFLLWGYALRYSTATKMGSITFGIPVLVIVFSWLWNNEIPRGLTLCGGLLCLIGIIISWKDERKTVMESEENLNKIP